MLFFFLLLQNNYRQGSPPLKQQHYLLLILENLADHILAYLFALFIEHHQVFPYAMLIKHF